MVGVVAWAYDCKTAFSVAIKSWRGLKSEFPGATVRTVALWDSFVAAILNMAVVEVRMRQRRARPSVGPLGCPYIIRRGTP